ncbi:phenylalanine--tRNA ligase subunit beta [Fimbriimonas ginsengisoli]|uniref:Phenylalanine--tRNA ligase beta subunit n=1 Tax=Fimbriimonas ginsengisoli Gsoil 348 TaxID=661478 RepID=A0A068NJ67_FIMGI|nr:phenylalanine--tRNA ligase subunit beta [Fimbriimonas ginsengisoli]AIE83638.1 phenylalanyl-tRNA synthetase beta subunit [Fimbriimonas ginsengisoli Gsoil 348]
MKFPHSMLLDFVQTDLDANAIGDLLTMAGFELEGIEEVEGEPVLDIKVMSNRGDGLSVFGLSREVLAKDSKAKATDLYQRAAARFVDENRHDFELESNVATIEAEECNRFACRAFVGVLGHGESPAWMQKRLRQTGMRPISLLVDLTNYVMLELGQPLHAFDREKLHGGGIVVRYARPGDRLTTLNGEEHELNGQMMICDAERPVGVPGVMGGLETEVTASTKTVLLESANFRNTTVRKTRKQLGLATEASYRFERSVDPDGVVAAIHRFSELLAASAPDVKLSNIVDLYPRPPERRSIVLRSSRASRLLGMEITSEQAQSYLARLGFEVRPMAEPGTFEVTMPSWRPDILREEDLVEELGRVHGYERIPERLPEGTTTLGGPHGEYLAYDRLRETAVKAGFIQIVSHSLRDFHPLERSDKDRIGPRVVASPEHAILRDSLLPSLADAASETGGRNLHLVEMGQVFWREGSAYSERRRLALLSTGELLPSDRKGAESRHADFFSLKGSLQAILGGVNVHVSFVPKGDDPRFHPTLQAEIVAGSRSAGVIGQIHPDVAEALKLPAATFLAEIDVVDALKNGSEDIHVRSISRNPAVRRDMAVLVDKSVPYERVAAAIAKAAGDVLERQWLFDVFEGAGIPAGKHSLGIALQLRKAGENFTDEEANQVRDRAVAALAEFGATTR